MDAVSVLCLLGIFCSLSLAIDKTVPPDDLDGSGDDEDFSGSGFDSHLVDLDGSVDTTAIATLVPTVEGSTVAQEPEIVAKEETEVEVTTKSAGTTKTPKDIIEDLFAVDTAKEETTSEATIPPVQETTRADLMEENDSKKHHHHHHHPHHHTTTSSTSPPPEVDEHEYTTAVPPEGGVDPDFLAKRTTSSPDGESELHHIPQEGTTPVQDLAKHGVLHEETTSGSTSAYVDNEEVAVEPLDVDDLPALDSLLTTTVAADSPNKTDHPHHHHHHHHHHPHHHTTTSSPGGDALEVTTRPSVPIEQEGDVQEVEHTTSVAENEHPHHDHRHHIDHHETTPSTTVSAEAEEPHEGHTQEPKGRRVHAPDVRGTTVIPVINEDEHLPDDTENDDLSAASNVTMNPVDENDDILDSKEEGPSGVADEDMFFEATVPVIDKGRMSDPNDEETTPEDDGTSNASHGIMERKELLAGIIAGGVAGLVFAAFLVAFVLYRMKKKDEGSYSLEEPKQSNGGYQKPREQREFYA